MFFISTKMLIHLEVFYLLLMCENKMHFILQIQSQNTMLRHF